MANDATGVLWTRLPYFLSPQLSIYKHLSDKVRGLYVLEVGFGTGFGTVQLASTAKQVTATEMDVSAVAFAKEVFPLSNIRWLQHDIVESPECLRADVGVCLEVLEHVPDWRTALKHLALACDTLYISGPNANGTRRKGDRHEREWSAQEFYDSLHEFFSEVSLFNYSLTEKQGLDTRLTPLLAVCKNG